MPYYSGDYYVGDPGLFSFLKKAAKGVWGVVKKVAPVALPFIGGPVGAIGGALLGGGGGIRKLARGALLGAAGPLGAGVEVAEQAGLFEPAFGFLKRGTRAAGGTPGLVAAAHSGRVRVRYRRRRRRRRY